MNVFNFIGFIIFMYLKIIRCYVNSFPQLRLATVEILIFLLRVFRLRRIMRISCLLTSRAFSPLSTGAYNSVNRYKQSATREMFQFLSGYSKSETQNWHKKSEGNLWNIKVIQSEIILIKKCWGINHLDVVRLKEFEFRTEKLRYEVKNCLIENYFSFLKVSKKFVTSNFKLGFCGFKKFSTLMCSIKAPVYLFN